MKHLVSVTVTFDRQYIEPAIITLYEVWKANCEIIAEIGGILILEDETSGIAELDSDIELLKRLITVTDVGGRHIKILTISDYLPKIKVHHFNNVVIHKLFAPVYYSGSTRFHLNIDAGFLLGHRFNELMINFIKQLKEKPEAVLGLIGEDLNHQLPPDLDSIRKLDFYPKGGLLIFDKEKYLFKELNQTLLECFLKYHRHFTYPDQDLLSICLEPDEVTRLVDLQEQSVFVRYLWPDHLAREPSAVLDDRNFALYKIAGLLKPWQYHVQDPEKSLYLARRVCVDKILNLDRSLSVNKAREHIPRHDLLVMSLKLYETILLENYLNNIQKYSCQGSTHLTT